MLTALISPTVPILQVQGRPYTALELRVQALSWSPLDIHRALRNTVGFGSPCMGPAQPRCAFSAMAAAAVPRVIAVRATEAMYLVILVGGHRDEGGLWEHMGAESRVFGAEGIVLIGLDNVEPRLVLVHGVEDDLEHRGLTVSSRSLFSAPWPC